CGRVKLWVGIARREYTQTLAGAWTRGFAWGHNGATMQRRSRHAVWLLGLSSCTTPPEQAVGELGVQTEFVLLEDAPPLYPAFDPGDVTALDVLYVAEPTGDGYQHRPI